MAPLELLGYRVLLVPVERRDPKDQPGNKDLRGPLATLAALVLKVRLVKLEPLVKTVFQGQTVTPGQLGPMAPQDHRVKAARLAVPGLQAEQARQEVPGSLDQWVPRVALDLREHQAVQG